jgi:alpha-tubulin suppressor-like RCC1 family protein
VAISLPGSRSFKSISVSWGHTLAVATDGTVWGWGGNSNGEIGADPTAIEYSATPRQIVLSGTIVDVAATGSWPASIAVTDAGQVWEWGTWGNTAFVPTRRTLPSNMGSSVINGVVSTSWNATLFPANDGSIWGKGGWGSVDLDGNCGANASDYPMWRNGTTMPARPLVRVRSTGQFGPAFAEDELAIARLETGAGAFLPMDGSGTAPGQVGSSMSIVATSPASSCFEPDALTYDISIDGGLSYEDEGISVATNSYGQNVVTTTFTPTVAGRTRGIFRVKNPDGATVSYRFWLGIAAAAATPGELGGDSELPLVFETPNGQNAVAVGTDGFLYAWGGERSITGRSSSATSHEKITPRKLTTPDGVQFVDVSVASRSDQTSAAAALSDDGRLFTWGTATTDLVLGDIDLGEDQPSNNEFVGTTTTMLGSTNPSLTALVTEPREVVLPDGVQLQKVKIIPGRDYGKLFGVALDQNGTVWSWGGGPTSSGGRGPEPTVVSGLAGMSITELELSSVSDYGRILLRDGLGWYQWIVNTSHSCSMTCGYTDASPVFISDAAQVVISTSYWSADVVPRYELSSAGVLTVVTVQGSEIISLPNGRIPRVMSTGLGSLSILATDGTIWQLYSRNPYRVRTGVVSTVSRFAGANSSFVIDSSDSIYRQPWSYPHTYSVGTCAALVDGEISRSYDFGIRQWKVASTGALGPSNQQDNFAFQVDSPSVPSSESRYRSDWGSYVDPLTVRPTGELRLFGYMKSACAGADEVDVTWDLDDDGDFETSAETALVEANATYLATPRRSEANGSTTYEGFDSRWRQSVASIDAQAAGGSLESGSGRYVSAKLTSPFGSQTYRFAVVARPAKPAGRVGVSINSAARFTSSTEVNLDMVWPEGTTTAIISNDGSFSDAQEVPVASRVRWRLPAEGSGMLPTTVYVRFKSLSADGEGWSDYGEGEVNYSDDIVLDLSPPQVSSLSASAGTSSLSVSSVKTRTSTTRVVVRLDARDDASGIQSMQVTTDPAVPGPEKPFSRQVTMSVDRGSIAVRVKDNLGQWSPWSFTRISGFVPPSGGSGGETPRTPEPQPQPVDRDPDTPRVAPPSEASGDSSVLAPAEGQASIKEEAKSPSLGGDSAPSQAAKAVPSYQSKEMRIGGVLGSTKPMRTAIQTAGSSTAAAPKLNVAAGAVISPKVRGLPLRTAIGITMMFGKKRISLGEVVASKSGQVSLPKMQFTRSGTYVVALRTKVRGKTSVSYLRIIVTK